jgi:hypothetical protein
MCEINDAARLAVINREIIMVAIINIANPARDNRSRQAAIRMNSVDVAIGFVLRGSAERRRTADAIIQIYAIRAALRQRQLKRARLRDGNSWRLNHSAFLLVLPSRALKSAR